MLNPKELHLNATEALKNSYRGKVENAIKQAAAKGNMSITFLWDCDTQMAEFVEKFKDDKFIFPEGFSIRTGNKGMTVGWESAD